MRAHAAGGTMMVLGFLVAAITLSVPGIALAAVLLGGGWSFFHSSLQTWATSLAPAARGTSVALFVAALFAGSAVGSSLGATLAEHHAYRALFTAAAAAAVPLTLLAVTARARYTPPEA
ncbi:hypothetical protein [Kitasatospora sp. NPDC058190]|uniref:hypothetical protein n=1 Tax=Kitasatospora sp. NPDC058190 TaxID=3346371 RepID=UPI0036DC3B5F